MPMMSPRTQGLSTGVPSDQAKSLFDQGLSQMAYNVLINKLPNVAQDVVTFKVLESDPDEGGGVGAFVIIRQGQTIYVPVVMADNQIKPLDILYYKDMNVFLPLSKEWLQELDKLSIGELGHGTPTPSTLNTDVDIRNIVVPPTTGRYSYAADVSVEQAVKMAHMPFDQARVQEDPKPQFLEFLANAPNRVKRAAARLLETRPVFLKLAVWHYGEDALVRSLQPSAEKVADYGASLSRTGGLYIADKRTSAKEYRDAFGAQAPLAFQGVSLKGYFAKDDRKDLKKAVRVQNKMELQEPKAAGVYKLYKTDGDTVCALIINDPHDVLVCGHGGLAKAVGYEGAYRRHKPAPIATRYVGVTEDGKLIDSGNYRHWQGDSIVGEFGAMSDLEGSKIYKSVEDEAKQGPRVGQTGIFVARKGATFVATVPVYIMSISTTDDGQEIIVRDPNYDYQDPPTVRLLRAADGKPGLLINKHTATAHLGREYSFVPTHGYVEGKDLLTDPKEILRWTTDSMKTAGVGYMITVKHASDRGWSLGVRGCDPRFKDEICKVAVSEFPRALGWLAEAARIGVEDAEHALKEAQEHGRFEFFPVNDAQLEKVAGLMKLAEGDSKPKSKSKPKAGGEPDPAQSAMDQVAGAQQALAGQPTPTDMAVAEQMQNLQAQAQSIQQQMMLIQSIAQRANMIAGTGGMAGNPAAGAAALAGPMDPSMMGAGAPVGSMGGGQQQQPQGQPGAGGAMSPMGAGAPGMGAAPGQQMPSPGVSMMDPSMQQQQQGGGQQQGQSSQAAMTSDDGSVESLVSQVNPQFAEQAGQLNDAGVFDAAALAGMAQAPALKDMVSAYLPNLEKSLDNVGRVLLTLWMDESKIKGDIGDETFVGLEDNLRTTFRGLGELILKINQNTMVMRAPNESAAQE